MKILEIANWVAAGLMAATAICSRFASQWLRYLTDVCELENPLEISVYGFEVANMNTARVETLTVLFLFSISAVIIFSLLAMIFRNVHLIMKKSENTTPFQKDNIRMLKEIGIFSISIPIVGLVMSVIIRLVCGIDAVETSVSFDGVTMGLVVLCLTQVFAHGLELEQDVDGLL